jgi:hypothetical protein
MDAERSVRCVWPTAEHAGSVLKEVRVQGVQFKPLRLGRLADTSHYPMWTITVGNRGPVGHHDSATWLGWRN